MHIEAHDLKHLMNRKLGRVHREVDARLPGKGNSNSYGARPVHQIISMIKWIRTIRLSIKYPLFLSPETRPLGKPAPPPRTTIAP